MFQTLPDGTPVLRTLRARGGLQRSLLPEIVIDLREPEDELERAAYILESGYRFKVTRELLPFGDATWVYPDRSLLPEADPGGVVVERKTPRDLRSSFRDRLPRQLNGMLATGLICVLVIDGIPRMGRDYGYWWSAGDPPEAVMKKGRWGVSYWSLANYLLSVQRKGVLVYTCPDGKFAEALRYLHFYFGKKDHRVLASSGGKIFGPADPGLRLLLAIDGIGIQRAQALLAALGSPFAIAQAALTGELKRMKLGIGKSTETAVRVAFYGRQFTEEVRPGPSSLPAMGGRRREATGGDGEERDYAGSVGA